MQISVRRWIKKSCQCVCFLDKSDLHNCPLLVLTLHTDCAAGLTLGRTEIRHFSNKDGMQPENHMMKILVGERRHKGQFPKSCLQRDNFQSLKKEALYSSLLARDSIAIIGLDMELLMETRNLPFSGYAPTFSVSLSSLGIHRVESYGTNSSIGLPCASVLPQCLFLYLCISVLLFLHVKSCSGFQNKLLGWRVFSTWFVCTCIYEWWEQELWMA